MDIGWHVGDVIRKLREGRRWTQTRLAQASKLNKATIVSVEENASGIKRETYEKVALALDLNLGELFSMVPKGAQSKSTGAVFREDWNGAERRTGSDRRMANE